MEQKSSRKQQVNQYKNRVQIGGVFVIRNSEQNRWFIDCTANLEAAHNRYKSLPESFLKIAPDYQRQHGKGFVFEVLEQLKRGEQQSDSEFLADLNMLKSLWLEKLSGQNLY